MALQSQVPPLLPAVRVPSWVTKRLEALFKEPPHFKTSYYGPLNMLLVEYFPSIWGFMVKPQARLREPADPSIPNQRTSIDSYGEPAVSTNNFDNPDFLVTVGHPTLDADIPLLIVEIKRECITDNTAAYQMDRYCIWANNYIRRRIPQQQLQIPAILVKGSKCTIFHMKGDVINLKADDIDIDTLDNKVIELFETIRRSNAVYRA